MKIIKAKLADTILELTEVKNIQEHQINTAQIVFNFDETWNDYTKFVVFKDDQKKIYKEAIINDTCIIPSELSGGVVQVQVYGEKIENETILERKPSEIKTLLVIKSINPDGVESEEEKADILGIYVTKINQIDNKIETLKAKNNEQDEAIEILRNSSSANVEALSNSDIEEILN